MCKMYASEKGEGRKWCTVKLNIVYNMQVYSIPLSGMSVGLVIGARCIHESFVPILLEASRSLQNDFINP